LPKKEQGKIHIGTSGWHYEHWKGPFYPKDISNKAMLDFYGQQFLPVELNNTFYRLPFAKTFKDWAEEVPKNFIFSVKASRYITHFKKLQESKTALKKFLNRVLFLKDKLGVILFQLPENFPIHT
jgi:uncharacterized protein YecE (DUF72 family)